MNYNFFKKKSLHNKLNIKKYFNYSKNSINKNSFLYSFRSRTIILFLCLTLSTFLLLFFDNFQYDHLFIINFYLFIFFISIRILNLGFFTKAKRYDNIANFLEIHEEDNFDLQNKFLHNIVFPEDIIDEHYEVYSKSIPRTFLGGDLIFQRKDIQNNYWFGIGDASGHDINSHLYSISILNRLSYLINHCSTPMDLNKEINKEINNKINEKKLNLSNYSSLLILKCDDNGNFLHFGQHPNLVIYRCKENKIEIIETTGGFIGLSTVNKNNTNGSFRLSLGDILITFTDGIFEQKNSSDNYYGYKLYDYIRNNSKENLENFTINLFLEINDFSDGEPKDDMSVLIIKKKK